MPPTVRVPCSLLSTSTCTPPACPPASIHAVPHAALASAPPSPACRVVLMTPPWGACCCSLRVIDRVEHWNKRHTWPATRRTAAQSNPFLTPQPHANVFLSKQRPQRPSRALPLNCASAEQGVACAWPHHGAASPLPLQVRSHPSLFLAPANAATGPPQCLHRPVTLSTPCAGCRSPQQTRPTVTPSPQPRLSTQS